MHCSFCGIGGNTLDQDTFECSSCTSEFLIEKQFAIIKYIAQGGFGRMLKIKEIYTGVQIALKERKKDDQVSQENWEKEKQILIRIEKEIPNLITPRLICCLDDSTRSIKGKYMLMELVDGSDLSNVSHLFQKFVHDKEFQVVRLFFILLNELHKIHFSNFLHRDIRLDNIMFYERDSKYYYCFVGFSFFLFFLFFFTFFIFLFLFFSLFIFLYLLDFGSSCGSNIPFNERVRSYSHYYSAPEHNTSTESFASNKNK